MWAYISLATDRSKAVNLSDSYFMLILYFMLIGVDVSCVCKFKRNHVVSVSDEFYLPLRCLILKCQSLGLPYNYSLST